jgi:hypothetical protein
MKLTIVLEGVLLDMDNRTIAWSFDGKLYPIVNLPPGDFTRLYPAVSFIQSGEWVTINFNAAKPIVKKDHPISPISFEDIWAGKSFKQILQISPLFSYDDRRRGIRLSI